MRIFILSFFTLFISSCSQHWESPSSKLASQADNYLDNDKIDFFSTICEVTSRLIRCNTKYASHSDSLECVRRAREDHPSQERVKTFLTPEQGREMISVYNEFKRNTENCSVECVRREYNALWENRLNIYSKAYPECREVASE